LDESEEIELVNTWDKGYTREGVFLLLNGKPTSDQIRGCIGDPVGAEYATDWVLKNFPEEVNGRAPAAYRDLKDRCFGTVAMFVAMVVEEWVSKGITFEPEEFFPEVPPTVDDSWVELNESLIMDCDRRFLESSSGYADENHEKCLAVLGEKAFAEHSEKLGREQVRGSDFEEFVEESGEVTGMKYAAYVRSTDLRNRYWRSRFIRDCNGVKSRDWVARVSSLPSPVLGREWFMDHLKVMGVDWGPEIRKVIGAHVECTRYPNVGDDRDLAFFSDYSVSETYRENFWVSYLKLKLFPERLVVKGPVKNTFSPRIIVRKRKKKGRPEASRLVHGLAAESLERGQYGSAVGCSCRTV